MHATRPDSCDKTHACPQSLSQTPTKISPKVCICGEKDVPLQQTRQYMDSSDEKTLMESLDPVIVELLKENVRLRGEIDRLKERLDNKARLMIFQEGYIDKQSQAIKTLKSDKYQKPKYQEKLKEVDDRYKSRIKSLEASYLYKEETLRYYIDNFRKEKIMLVEENNKLRDEKIKLHDEIINKPIEQAKHKKENDRQLEKIDELKEKINKLHEKNNKLHEKIDDLNLKFKDSQKIISYRDQIIEKLRNNIKDLKTDVYEKPVFKEMLQDAVIDYMRKLNSQEALYKSKLHIQKTINKLLGKEIAELKAKLSEDLNKS